MPRILVVDNYDSFTFNVVQALRALGADVDVRRHDAVSVDQIVELAPDGIVISPGPCAPRDAGVSVDVVRATDSRVRCPILGICLGHQAIAAAFDAAVVRVEPVHGRASAIEHDGAGVFEGLPCPLVVGRYHSLAVDEATLPAELVVTARVDGVVMALRHRERRLEGVQFHPESVLSERGSALFANWLRSF